MTNRRKYLVGLLAGASLALAAAVAWSPADDAPVTTPTGVDVLLIGVDGLDWVLVGRYVDAGMLPNLARLLRSGVAGEIEAVRPVLPDGAWTVIGRGGGLTERERSKLSEPGGRLFGVVPGVLAAAHSAGASVAAIGWPSSWPVVPGGPPIVAVYEPASRDHPLGLTASLFGVAPGQATSPELRRLIEEAVDRGETSLEREFAETILGDDAGRRVEPERAAAARLAFLSDTITLDVAARVLAEEEPDLTLVCLRGLDAVAHRFLASAARDTVREGGRAPAPVGVLPSYYRFVDGAIGRLLRLTDRRTLVIVCSPYGTHPSAACPPASGGHERGAPGVLLVRGPHLGTTGEQPRVSAVDLAPTVLAAIGVPAPAGMEGRPIDAALPEWISVRPPRSAGLGHEPRALTVPDRAELDIMESLVAERLRAADLRR